MIRETATNVAKNPQALALYLINMAIQNANIAGAAHFSPLKSGVRVSLVTAGFTLAVHRKLFFAASHIMFEKGWLPFIINHDEILVFNVKNVKDWSALKEHNNVSKLGAVHLDKLFKLYHVTKGGKSAFFSFIKNLTSSNSKKGGIVRCPAALVTSAGLVPYILLKNKEVVPIVGEEGIPFTPPTGTSWKIGGDQPYVKKPNVPKVPSLKALPNIVPHTGALLSKSIHDLVKVPVTVASKLKDHICHKVVKDLAPLVGGDETKAYEIIDKSMRKWADSSSNNNESVALQKHIANQFSIKQQTAWIMSKKGSASYEPHLPALVSVVYNQTQKFLKENGHKTLTLFRGMEAKELAVNGLMGVKNVLLNPLSSFASDLGVAWGFGSKVMAVTVPIEKVFSCCATGHGCLSEHEFTVIGGKVKAAIIDFDRITDLEVSLGKRLAHFKSKQEKEAYLLKLDKKVPGLKDSYSMSGESFSTKKLAIAVFNAKLKKVSLTASQLPGSLDAPIDWEETEESSDWIKQGLNTAHFPYVGTPRFAKFLTKNRITFEQAMKLRPYRKAHIRYASVISLLLKLAVTYDPTQAKKQVQPIHVSSKSLCHIATLKGIQERGEKLDKIWFFGTGSDDNGLSVVFHSLLTDRNNHIVANNFAGAGSNASFFDQRKGYKTPTGEYLPILDVVSVKEFMNRFLK